MAWKNIKWIGIIILVFIFGLISYYAITGFPKPSTITAVNVPSIKWTNALKIYQAVKTIGSDASFKGWSGNGDQIIVEKTENLKTKLFYLNTPKGELQPITGIPEGVKYFRINPNPDKKYLLYLNDTDGNEKSQLYRFDFETGRSFQISDGKNKYGAPRFNHKGDKILYVSNQRDKNERDLYMMNPEDPESYKLIFKNVGSISIDNWSLDESKVILRRHKSANENMLVVMDLEKQKPKPIGQAKNTLYFYSEWSNDGTKLYYASDYQSEFAQLRVRDFTTGKDSVLTKDIPWNVSNVTVSDDGTWLAFTVNNDGVKQIHVLNLITGKQKKIETDLFGVKSTPNFHPKTNTIGFNLTRPSGSSIIYTFNLENNQLIQWSQPESSSVLPDPEIIHYPTFDIDTATGQTRKITAYYHRPPPSFEKPTPVIIKIHGGPDMQESIIRDPLMPKLLNDGFALLVPNIRGSLGYGKNFVNLDNGRLREDAIKDIGSLLDWIRNQPKLDSNKVILMGGSYGGFMVLTVSTKYSDRILGGIDAFGFSNIVTELETTELREQYMREEYGNILNPEMRNYLKSISPLSNVGEIDVPLLIYHGENDTRVHVSESRQMVEKLQAKGKEFWYIEANNEGHGLEHIENNMYVRGAYLTFIDYLMKK